tara:strand:- start:37 stop:396 length:360 start_codon:yes stop_codon:yes gene_type:complete
MKKFLYFAASAPDSNAANEEVACFPADQLSHLEMASATQLRVYFESSQENDADSGIDAAHAVLTITSGKHKEVIEAVCGAIASANAINNPFIVVADSENSKFLHPNIEACASIAVVDAS